MKKIILLLVLFIMSCEKYAPTEHTHDTSDHTHDSADHTHDGVCVRYDYKIGGADLFKCYSVWNQMQCLEAESYFANNVASNQDAYDWITDMTCEEFCELDGDPELELDCEISTEDY